MDFLSEDKQDKSHISEWMIDYDKNSISNSNILKGKKDILLRSCNDHSVLKQNYPNTQLKNISINFGFPNTINTYKYKNTFPLSDFPMFEQRNVFYYDKNFQLFKNKSVSKYGEKKSNSISHSKNSRIFSPQHKITTSIKKKKYLDDKVVDKKIEKSEKDIYELEVVNQVLYDDEAKLSQIVGKELDNEWGEIEQFIFDNEKNKKNNLLNSVYVEIEKENGDKQLKVVEITKEDKFKKEPCIKVKYTIEDRICLNSGGESGGEEIASIYDRDTKDSVFKSLNYKTNTSSTFNNNYSLSSIKRPEYSTLKKENVSEILLKENKSSQNTLSATENEKIYFSGSIPNSKKYQKYSNYQKNLMNQKEKRKENDTYDRSSAQTKKLVDIINDDNEEKLNRYGYSSRDIKRSPKVEQSNEEIQIKIEKGIKTQGSPIRKEKEEIKFSPRFKAKEKGSPKSTISDRYKSFDEQEKIKDKGKAIIENKYNIEGKGLREKYRNKNEDKDKDKDNNELKKINIEIKKSKYNNITSVTEQIPEIQSYKKDTDKNSYFTKQNISDNKFSNKKNEENHLNRSQFLKDFSKQEGTEIERPRISKRFVKKHKEEETEQQKPITMTNFEEKKTHVRRFGVKNLEQKLENDEDLFKYRMQQNQTEKEKEKKENLSEVKQGYKAKYQNKMKGDEYNISTKKETFQRNFDTNESIDFNNKNKKQISSYKTEIENREKERLEKEAKEKERKEKQRLEIEREIEMMEKEKERIRVEKQKERERAKIEKEKEREKLEKERKEKERLEQLEREKKERLAQERREKERLERERQEKIERERKEKEKQELERQRLERERQEKLERDRREKERQESERKARLERERQERERQEKIERERKEKEKQDRERQEKLERERKERERQEREKQEKIERERLERERQQKIEREKIERERQDRERNEKLERDKKEKQERERKERERIENERIERERQEKIEREKREREKERKEKEKRALMDKDFNLKTDQNINRFSMKDINEPKYKRQIEIETQNLYEVKDRYKKEISKKEITEPQSAYQRYKSIEKKAESKMESQPSIKEEIKGKTGGKQLKEEREVIKKHYRISENLPEEVETKETKTIRNKYLSLKGEEKKESNIKNKLKEIEITKDISNKGNSEGKRFRYTTYGSDKKPETEKKIFKSNLNEYNQSPISLPKKTEEQEKSEIISTQYKYINREQEPKKRFSKDKEDYKITKNRFMNSPDEKETTSKFSKYSKNVPSKNINEEKVEMSRSLFQRSYQLPDKEKIVKKNEIKTIKNIYKREEPESINNKFNSTYQSGTKKDEKVVDLKKEYNLPEKKIEITESKWRRSLDKRNSNEKEVDNKKEMKSMRFKSQTNIQNEEVETNKNKYNIKDYRKDNDEIVREKIEVRKVKSKTVEKEEKKEREMEERKEREEKERKEKERLEMERQRVEKERKEKERLEIERQRVEKERKEKERIERERKERERQEKLERERKERERQEREKQEKIEKERKEKERLERERQEKLEREKKEREKERERIERERQEKAERERKEKEREKQERERQEKLERERREKERLEKERQDKLERERKEKERLERERQEKIEREKKERERQERLERERKEKEKLERERQEKLERERREKERFEREKQEKLEREKKERERQERLERERKEKERLRQEK